MPPTVARVCLTTRCDLACDWCPFKRLRFRCGGKGVDAKWETTRKYIIEIADMCIPRIEPDGGDILLIEWLPQALEFINALALHCSITLSGQMLRQRLHDWGKWWLGLPDVLRFSAEGMPDYHDTKRAVGCFNALVEGLEATAKVRKKKPTLLVLTLVLGRGGNINRTQIQSVLELAQQYGAMVVANFLFGTHDMGRKDECGKMWASLTGQELEVLDWLSGQPEVLPFADKLAFIRGGGNDTENTTCRASEAILVISSGGRVVRHCSFSPHGSAQIKEGGIRGAMAELDKLYQEKERLGQSIASGTVKNYCEGCGVLCNIGVCWARERGLTGTALADELMRF